MVSCVKYLIMYVQYNITTCNVAIIFYEEHFKKVFNFMLYFCFTKYRQRQHSTVESPSFSKNGTINLSSNMIPSEEKRQGTFFDKI